mmetsp:Transcript_2285/g.6728  ORF Transcript_2285/g.6728 Transcript_2285/m.6728 type:complete len:208 (-) Transcript_2285:719-1342(-)
MSYVPPAPATALSFISQEVHHVALGHHVVLALGPQLAALLGHLLGPALHVVSVRDRLRADETLLKVGVDHARGLRRLVARADRPRPRLRLAAGEVRAQPQQLVRLADQLLEPRLALLDAELLEEGLPLLAVQLHQLRLHLRRHNDRRRPLRRRERAHLLDHLVPVGQLCVGHVCRVDDGLGREQPEPLDTRPLLVVELGLARGRASV